MIKYHDKEWGFLNNTTNEYLFEFLILEGAQAGLSWSTILKKREGYRKAYMDYDIKKISNFTEKDKANLISNAEIVRNKAKITASIVNAKLYLKILDEYQNSFLNYLNSFEYTNVARIQGQTSLTESEISKKISSDLSKRGFKFVGSKIIHAYLQAIGIIDDHDYDCFLHQRNRI
ncbi:hypothetical protein HDU92_003155 [Lobulomyces angularis]|nr:hypothetical protein HDU92_003155 [Lobulomyces angularis]